MNAPTEESSKPPDAGESVSKLLVCGILVLGFIGLFILWVYAAMRFIAGRLPS